MVARLLTAFPQIPYFFSFSLSTQDRLRTGRFPVLTSNTLNCPSRSGPAHDGLRTGSGAALLLGPL